MDLSLFDFAARRTIDHWVPVNDVAPTLDGRPLPGAPPLHLARVTSLGLMILDRQAGPFRLEIARIAAYAD